MNIGQPSFGAVKVKYNKMEMDSIVAREVRQKVAEKFNDDQIQVYEAKPEKGMNVELLFESHSTHIEEQIARMFCKAGVWTKMISTAENVPNRVHRALDVNG